jgi:hypothetical protein
MIAPSTADKLTPTIGVSVLDRENRLQLLVCGTGDRN